MSTYRGTNKNHMKMPSSAKTQGKGHPVMFTFKEAPFIDFPDGGGYPKRFLELAYPILGVTDESKVLHLCSGSVRTGVRVDIRSEMKPDVVADCRKTPFPDESFNWIMADPPYSEDYAKSLYGTEKAYPAPYEIVQEASRLLRPGGRFGILHFQVPYFHKPMRLIGVWGITQGIGFNIRAFSVFEKISLD